MSSRARFVLAAACGTLFAGSAMADDAVVGAWSVRDREDPAGYRRLVSLEQESQDAIRDETATKEVNPLLALQCTPGNTEVSISIDWRRFISSFNTEVGFKVDGGKMLWQKWGVDATNQITSSKSASDARSLLAALTAGRELLVDISPYSESPLQVRFNLEGLPQGVEDLAIACQ